MNTGQNVDGWISSATSTAAVAVSAAESPSLADLERRIQQLLARKGMFSDPSSVYEMQADTAPHPIAVSMLRMPTDMGSAAHAC
eukprot:1150116-Pleurochrysis_carterae.AAC.1